MCQDLATEGILKRFNSLLVWSFSFFFLVLILLTASDLSFE